MKKDKGRTRRTHVDVNTSPVAMVTTVISETRVVTMVTHSNGIYQQRTVVNCNLSA